MATPGGHVLQNFAKFSKSSVRPSCLNDICGRIKSYASLARHHNIHVAGLPSVNVSREHHCEVPNASLYGGRYTVTLIPGDGIGPEMATHVRAVFKSGNVPVDFEEVTLDRKKSDEEEVEYAVHAIKRNGVALKGNLETNFSKPGFVSRNVEMRKQLDVYANVITCKTIAGIPSKHKGINITMIRENTEGEYSGIEHESVPGVVENLKIITRKNSERIAKYAFELARQQGRKKVTAVHKANIMKLGDGLFLDTCKQVSKNYSEIEFEGMIVDNCCMQLVSKPQQFDVMVMPNLYGNIVGNLGCGLVGGPGVVPGKNVGDEFAIFETGARTTAYNIVGKNVANPTAILLAAADMLSHLRLDAYAFVVRNAVMHVLTKQKVHTKDVGGDSSTTDFVKSVVDVIIDHEEHAKTSWQKSGAVA